MNILLFAHAGLGDQLIMNAYVHYLLNNVPDLETICIVAKRFQERTLKHLYSDYNKITYYWINAESESSHMNYDSDPFLLSIHQAPFSSSILHNNKIYHLHNFGCHSNRAFNIFITNWADAFYLQVNLNPQIRKIFHLPSDMSRSSRLLSNVKQFLENKEYIIIHDDPSRNLNINYKKLYSILESNNTLSCPVLYLGKGRYDFPLFENLKNEGSNELLKVESLIDFTDILKNAKECHLINSSISILADYTTSGNNNIYIHLYVTSDGTDSVKGQHIHFSDNIRYIDTL